jgi:hypothetical protein
LAELHPKVEELLRELLPTMDNLELAVRAISDDADTSDAVSEGIRAIHRQLLDLLGRYDVRSFTSVGTLFDPSRHEAMAAAQSNELPPNHISKEIRPGYMIGDRLFRPAQVLVVTERAKEADGTEWGGGDGTSSGAKKQLDRSSMNRPAWLGATPPANDTTLYFVGSASGVSSADVGKREAADRVVPQLVTAVGEIWPEHPASQAYLKVSEYVAGRSLPDLWSILVAAHPSAEAWVEDFFWERLKSEVRGSMLDVAVLAAVKRESLKVILDSNAAERWGGMSVCDLGALLSTVLGRSEGAIITEIFSGGIADRAGLLVGDVIHKVDRRPIANAAGARRILTLQGNSKPFFELYYARGLEATMSLRLEGRRTRR